MNLLPAFEANLRKLHVIQKERHLIAVSGGIDSVVLCHLMVAAGYDFAIAHCNFKLRGQESERDAQFVQSMGAAYGKQVWVKECNTEEYAQQHNVSIQVAARELRYAWFAQLLRENGPDNKGGLELSPHTYLLTAHHANDNIETVLMNFFKGTGIAGLHGILPVHGKIIRPLLFATKNELLTYAKQHNLAHVEDSSNSGDKYTRNFFRHQLFPLLQSRYPMVEENLLRNIERFREAEDLYSQAIAIHKKKLLAYKGSEVHIPVLKLKKSQPVSTILFEIIKDYGFTSAQVKEANNLLDSNSGKYIESATYRLLKNRQWLIIAPIKTEEAAHIIIEKQDKQIVFSAGEMHISVRDWSSRFETTTLSNTALINLNEIRFPLLLRRWKRGDYFYPLGMRKKKKLSRFFIDQKLSAIQKENIWVLEMDKKIVWIVGYRLDDRFKILPGTQKVLQITYQTV